MTLDTRRSLARLAVAALCAFAGVAGAHETVAGDLKLVHAWSPPSLAGTRNGAAYVNAIENAGNTADAVKGASTPVAGRVELHMMGMDQGVMRMRQIESLAVPAGGKVEMNAATGYHFMLTDLKQPLKVGDSFPMTIVFEKAGPVQVNVVVQERTAASGAAHKH